MVETSLHHLTLQANSRRLLTWVVFVARHLLEAVVERQIVTDGVLPASFAFVVEGEVVSNILVDLTECQPLFWCSVDGHGNEGRIGIRWPDQLHQLLLRRHREPAHFIPGQAMHAWQELPLHSICRWDVWSAIGSRKVRWRIDGRSIQPQVRVRGGIVLRRFKVCRPLRTRNILRMEEVFIVDVHFRRFLADVWKLWTAAWWWVYLRIKGAHNLALAVDQVTAHLCYSFPWDRCITWASSL